MTSPETAPMLRHHNMLTQAEEAAHQHRTARNREAARLHRDGMSVPQLAELLGMSPRGLYKALEDQEG